MLRDDDQKSSDNSKGMGSGEAVAGDDFAVEVSA
jgi:hypothetical protein